MDPAAVAPLGVYGVTVLILLYILNKSWDDKDKLWARIEALQTQMHDDQAAMLPALEASQAAMTASQEAMTKMSEAAQANVIEIARLTARAERS